MVYEIRKAVYMDIAKTRQARNVETRYLNGEIRASHDTASIVGSIPYSSLSVDFGDWREELAPRAFHWTPDLLALWQHNWAQPLGTLDSGGQRLSVEHDEDELRYMIDLEGLDTSYARDALTAAREELIRGTSFRFLVENPDDEDWIDGDPMVRRILRAKLVEISPVTNPAYTESKVSARTESRARDLMQERQEQIEAIRAARADATQLLVSIESRLQECTL